MGVGKCGRVAGRVGGRDGHGVGIGGVSTSEEQLQQGQVLQWIPDSQ